MVSSGANQCVSCIMLKDYEFGICKLSKNARPSLLAESIGEWLLNEDITIEVLSRLPIGSVVEIKFVSKWWDNLITGHPFRYAHFQKSQNTMCGTFLQGVRPCICGEYMDFEAVDYVGFGKESKCVVRNTTLDFLPEKVVITGSSNGLLICRSTFRWNEHIRCLRLQNPRSSEDPVNTEPGLYVCNPLTKEFIALKLNLVNKARFGVGLAFNSNSTFYQVVVVEFSQRTSCYLFRIYSSRTGRWRVSKEICCFPYIIYFHRYAVLDQMFYWLTAGPSILAFDLKSEQSQIITLPGPLTDSKRECGMCPGKSNGKLHYVCISCSAFRVWMLNSDCEWELKHFRHVSSQQKLVEPKNWNFLPNPCRSNRPNPYYEPFTLVDDILYLRWNFSFCAYHLKTGNLETLVKSFHDFHSNSRQSPVLVPYAKSLLPVRTKLSSSRS